MKKNKKLKHNNISDDLEIERLEDSDYIQHNYDFIPRFDGWLSSQEQKIKAKKIGLKFKTLFICLKKL